MINSYHDHHHDMMISIFMIIWLWSTLRHRALFLIRPTIDMSGVYTCKVDLSFINDWSIVDHCLYMLWLDCLHVQGWSLIVTINLSWERCWPDHASFMPGTCSCKIGKNYQLPTPCFSFFSCVVWTLPEDQGDVCRTSKDSWSAQWRWKTIAFENIMGLVDRGILCTIFFRLKDEIGCGKDEKEYQVHLLNIPSSGLVMKITSVVWWWWISSDEGDDGNDDDGGDGGDDDAEERTS